MAGGSGMGGDDVFERFGPDLRTAVLLGYEEAKALGATRVRPEHLLLGLALEREGPAAALLAEQGLDEPAARRLLRERAGSDLDGAALAAIGIDVDQVRASVEQTFGRGALDRVRLRPRRHYLWLDSAAKQVFQGTLREHRAAGDRRARLDGLHMLPALLDLDDPGVNDVVRQLGMDADVLRQRARRRRGVA
jgi:ATP-dependent Clp protease ATP-binding subunit ClpA